MDEKFLARTSQLLDKGRDAAVEMLRTAASSAKTSEEMGESIFTCKVTVVHALAQIIFNEIEQDKMPEKEAVNQSVELLRHELQLLFKNKAHSERIIPKNNHN